MNEAPTLEAGTSWTTLDFRVPEAWQEMHALLARARERHPLALNAVNGAWSILRYADVDALLRDERLESVGPEMFTRTGLTEGPFQRFVGRMLFTQNGEGHRRLRGLVARAFTPRMAGRMRGRMRAIAHELVDRIEGNGEAEFVEEVAHHLPVRVISEMVGVPESDYPRFAQWTSELGLGFTLRFTPDLVRSVDAATEGLHAYVGELIEERRRHLGDDLVSELIRAEEEGDRLSHDELVAMIVNLLFGGHDTTKSLLQIAVYTLLRHPAEWERLGREPERAPAVVEEVLRYEAIVSGVVRTPRTPIEIGGVKLDVGEQLFLSLASANRDPRRFSDADRFDPDRADNRHLGFGHGLHFCLGAALARAEAQEALRVLSQRLPKLALAEEPRWRPFTAIRRFETLRLAW